MDVISGAILSYLKELCIGGGFGGVLVNALQRAERRGAAGRGAHSVARVGLGIVVPVLDMCAQIGDYGPAHGAGFRPVRRWPGGSSSSAVAPGAGSGMVA